MGGGMGSEGGGKVGEGRVWRAAPGGDMDGGWAEAEGWDWYQEGRWVEAWEVRVEGGSEGKLERRMG